MIEPGDGPLLELPDEDPYTIKLPDARCQRVGFHFYPKADTRSHATHAPA